MADSVSALAEMGRCVERDSLPPPPGWQLYMCSRCSGHVADTPVGEIPGYAQLPPPAGVAEMSAFCHRLRRRRWGCDTSRPRNQMQIPPIQWMINQPNRQRWDAIHIYIDTNIEKWNPHGVGAIAIGSDARLRNPKSLRILIFLEKMDGVEERKSPVNRGFTGLGGEDEIRTRGRITPTTV